MLLLNHHITYLHFIILFDWFKSLFFVAFAYITTVKVLRTVNKYAVLTHTHTHRRQLNRRITMHVVLLYILLPLLYSIWRVLFFLIWAVIFFVRRFYRFRIPLNACTRNNQSDSHDMCILCNSQKRKRIINDSLLLLLFLLLFNGLPEKLQSKHVSLFVFGVHLSKSLPINFHSHSFLFMNGQTI